MRIVDPSCPVNWGAPLNTGLQCWLITFQSSRGTLSWKNIAKPFHASLVNRTSSAWEGKGNARRGWGSFVTDGLTSSGYANVPHGGGLDSAQQGTIALWVRWDGTSQDNGFDVSLFGVVVSRQQNSSFSQHFIGLTGANPNTAFIKAGCYGFSYTTSSTSPGNMWRHVVYSFRSGERVLYMDGIQIASDATTGTIASNFSTPLSIGAWPGDGAAYSTAHIDDVRTYNRMLGAGEVWALYRASLLDYQEELNWLDPPLAWPAAADVAVASSGSLLLLGVGA